MQQLEIMAKPIPERFKLAENIQRIKRITFKLSDLGYARRCIAALDELRQHVTNPEHNRDTGAANRL